MLLMKFSDDVIVVRLINFVVIIYVDIEKILFERYVMFDKWLWIYCFNIKLIVIVICFLKYMFYFCSYVRV